MLRTLDRRREIHLVESAFVYDAREFRKSRRNPRRRRVNSLRRRLFRHLVTCPSALNAGTVTHTICTRRAGEPSIGWFPEAENALYTIRSTDRSVRISREFFSDWKHRNVKTARRQTANPTVWRFPTIKKEKAEFSIWCLWEYEEISVSSYEKLSLSAPIFFTWKHILYYKNLR